MHKEERQGTRERTRESEGEPERTREQERTREPERERRVHVRHYIQRQIFAGSFLLGCVFSIAHTEPWPASSVTNTMRRVDAHGHEQSSVDVTSSCHWSTRGETGRGARSAEETRRDARSALRRRLGSFPSGLLWGRVDRGTGAAVPVWMDVVACSACVALPGAGAAGRSSYCSASSSTTTWACCSTARPSASARPQRSTATSPTAATSSPCCPSRAAAAAATPPGTSRTCSRTSPPCECCWSQGLNQSCSCLTMSVCQAVMSQSVSHDYSDSNHLKATSII